MKDARTLAFVNFFGVLGALGPLCALDEKAAALVAGKTISVGFSVKDGPQGSLDFADGGCRVRQGVKGCDILLPFGSCARFNGMIDGTVTPVPTKGIFKAGFLTGPFIKLTDMLSAYLRPAPEALEDEAFFRVSTLLMMYVIAGAAAQIGNEDAIGRTSASYIVDGAAKLGIEGEIAVGIEAKDHRLTALYTAPERFTSYMSFSDLHLARDIFDGRANSVACVGEGKVRVGGMISQVDNINRILDRVAEYLA